MENLSQNLGDLIAKNTPSIATRAYPKIIILWRGA
jgi:hypothetical protein